MANLKRNDPCHCGSGKKYKKCHMKADRARETFGGSDRDVTDVITSETIPYFFWKEWKSARMRGEFALLWQMLDPDGPYANSFRDIDHFLLEAQSNPLPSGPEWAITKIKLDEKNAFVLSTRGEDDPTANDVKLELMHLIKTPQGWRLHQVDTSAVDKGEEEVFVAFDEFGIESADYALHLRQKEGFERPDLADREEEEDADEEAPDEETPDEEAPDEANPNGEADDSGGSDAAHGSDDDEAQS